MFNKLFRPINVPVIMEEYPSPPISWLIPLFISRPTSTPQLFRLLPSHAPRNAILSHPYQSTSLIFQILVTCTIADCYVISRSLDSSPYKSTIYSVAIYIPRLARAAGVITSTSRRRQQVFFLRLAPKPRSSEPGHADQRNEHPIPSAFLQRRDGRRAEADGVEDAA